MCTLDMFASKMHLISTCLAFLITNGETLHGYGNVMRKGDESAKVNYQRSLQTADWISMNELTVDGGEGVGARMGLYDVDFKVDDSTNIAIMAVGYPYGNSVRGYAEVFQYSINLLNSDNRYGQFGDGLTCSTAHGSNAYECGWSVAASLDGTVIAVGSKDNGDNREYGHLFIYKYDGTSWTEDASISGLTSYGWLSYQVSISNDGLKLAVSEMGTSHIASNMAGSVYLYEDQGGGSWSSLITFNGNSIEDHFGIALDMDDAGSVIVVGASAGYVNAYITYDGTNWVDYGINPIFTTSISEIQRNTVAVSGDGTTIAICEYNAAQATVLQWDGTNSWVQLGSVIETYSLVEDNPKVGGSVCSSIDIDKDGNTIIIGDTEKYRDGVEKRGRSLVHEYDSSTNSWSWKGSSQFGTSLNCGKGSVVAISPEGNAIVDSSPFFNDGILQQAFYDILSEAPSSIPSGPPSQVPSNVPSSTPSLAPTNVPSSMPSLAPTNFPSSIPSLAPSSLPSTWPSSIPSNFPSLVPTDYPTYLPSLVPSLFPSNAPSNVPSFLPSPSPSNDPSSTPSLLPSFLPSPSPSNDPSSTPSLLPSLLPTISPSSVPSTSPTMIPTNIPSQIPSGRPTTQPSNIPSNSPSDTPSFLPSSFPTIIPSFVPSVFPSSIPTVELSNFPTTSPSDEPSYVPSFSQLSPISMVPSFGDKETSNGPSSDNTNLSQETLIGVIAAAAACSGLAASAASARSASNELVEVDSTDFTEQPAENEIKVEYITAVSAVSASGGSNQLVEVDSTDLTGRTTENEIIVGYKGAAEEEEESGYELGEVEEEEDEVDAGEGEEEEEIELEEEEEEEAELEYEEEEEDGELGDDEEEEIMADEEEEEMLMAQKQKNKADFRIMVYTAIYSLKLTGKLKHAGGMM